MKSKINESLNVIEYVYPDVVILVRKWESENLIDFLEDPVAFIQNGFDLSKYLYDLKLDESSIVKLKKRIFNCCTYIQIKL